MLSLLGLIILSIIATGCQSSRMPTAGPPATVNLEASIYQQSSGSTHITLYVRNPGPTDFPGDDEFDAVARLQIGAGVDRMRIETHELDAVAAGETREVVSWEGVLIPGTYELIWQAPDYTPYVVRFNVP